jgi:lysophospholipase L1-like esterase
MSASKFGRRHTRLRRVHVAFGSLAIFFGSLELALRASGFEHPPAFPPAIVWNPLRDAELDSQDGLHRPSPRELWTPRAGALLPWGASERINCDGFRGPVLALEKPAGVLRVATLGDSSTFGFGVAWSDTWSAKLVGELAARGIACEVLDAGVIGSTIEQGLERYDELVRARHPDVVVAAYGAINEALGCDSGDDRRKIDALTSLQAPRTLLARARRDVRVLHLAAWGADLLRASESKAEKLRARKLQRALKRDDVAGRVEWPGVRRVAPERFARCVDELYRRVASDGARLVLISMPRAPVCESGWPICALYTREIEDAAQRDAVPLLDLRGIVLRELDAGAQWNSLFLDEFHPSPAGHDLIARELAPLIVAAR